ncbi:MAG: hypothetical protein PHU69_13115 [Fermentimonas sp.]|nr:hypothetical protein [Fermentimonas sp.]
MKRQKYEYRQLKITELLLNSKNPRFNPVKHQTEAIASMIEDQQDKLATLAQHIAEFGLNPTDIVLVQPQGNQWLVKEGNRRITALKIANEPSLAGHYPKIKKEFQKLNASIDRNILENIPCVIINDEELLNEWIRLKHTGQNDGAGTVSWDGQQTSRFRMQTNGKLDARILFLDELKKHKDIPQKYKDRFDEIKKTNFDRLMGDPDVRSILGIASENGVFSLPGSVNKYLLEVLYDLSSGNLTVGSIYYKEDRRKYIETLKTRIDQSDSVSRNTELDNVNDYVKNNAKLGSNSNGGSTLQTPLNGSEENRKKNIPTGSSSSNRGKSYPINRKTLIPAQHKLTISHPRIVKIFNELKSLDIDSYPNGTSVLFRVFIELSADCYINRNNLNGVNENSKLSKKIEAISDDFESKSLMNQNELRSARLMVSSSIQTQSIKTFHSYVHNKDITPSSVDLKSAWDDMWPFIENVWR